MLRYDDDCDNTAAQASEEFELIDAPDDSSFLLTTDDESIAGSLMTENRTQSSLGVNDEEDDDMNQADLQQDSQLTLKLPELNMDSQSATTCLNDYQNVLASFTLSSDVDEGQAPQEQTHCHHRILLDDSRRLNWQMPYEYIRSYITHTALSVLYIGDYVRDQPILEKLERSLARLNWTIKGYRYIPLSLLDTKEPNALEQGDGGVLQFDLIVLCSDAKDFKWAPIKGKPVHPVPVIVVESSCSAKEAEDEDLWQMDTRLQNLNILHDQTATPGLHLISGYKHRSLCSESLLALQDYKLGKLLEIVINHDKKSDTSLSKVCHVIFIPD